MKRVSFVILFFFIGICQGFSQTKEERKEFKRKFIEAEYFFLLEEFRESAFLYSELLKEDPLNANLNFLVGASYLSVPGQKHKSIPYLEKAVQSISPSYREGSYKERNAPKESLFAMARAYHIANKIDMATEYYNKYKTVMQIRDVAEIEYINKQIKSIELSKKMIQDTVNVKISSFLGDSEYAERSRYNAVFSEEKKMLLYMSDRPFYSAVMMTFLRNGKWTMPVSINHQIQVDGKIRLSSISADGTEMYLSRIENYNSELFVSYFKDSIWTKAELLPENINTIFNETHASLSQDKLTLYFTSDKPGGMGAMDIYKVKRKKDGEWGLPENLGKPINSLYSEETPYLTEDGKTLYFSSMSHATMGGFDIFYSTRLPNGNWSYPANLGFPISTNDDDLHYHPINNGLQAIYTGSSELFPGTDLALISPGDQTDNNLIALKGKVVLEDNGIMDSATVVELVNVETREILATTNPDPETGEYSFDVEAGNYEINIGSTGYDSLKSDVSINPQHLTSEINVESNLTPEEVSRGEYVVAKNILFGFDSDALSDEAQFELEKMYKIMNDNPEMLLELTGHTDSKGSAEYNLRLSNRRSKAVRNYLVARGISEDRFISKAVGEASNIAINENPDGTDNAEGRKYNRQVELKLVNSGDKDIWLEEYMVPEHLKPEGQKKYYVILDDTSVEIKDLRDDFENESIKLFETGRKHIYAAGEFSNKRNAIEFLNEAIETDFPEGRIVTEDEFEYLLQPSVPDLERVKGPFTIQLLALRNAIPIDNFETPEIIRQIRSSDGFYRYLTGIFDIYSEAQDSLVNFVLKGYTDAFIIPLSRFDKSLGENEILTENYDYYFTIQFVATRKPADNSFFENIPDVQTIKGADGFYRYSTGIYLNKPEAEKILMQIKSKGYRDAFIKKVSKN
jgi:outer membrane protein OmpA-like peptidoglycan-associated protein